MNAPARPALGIRTYHMQMDLRGLLRRAVDIGKFADMLRHPTEDRTMTPDEAFDAIFDQVKRGRECIPLAAGCDNFDFTGSGCQGHPSEPRLAVVAGTDIAARAWEHPLEQP